ncbi:hypothetical protein BCF55_0453 [Hydrogenivirga caldilitoris]|uniref:Uncharacterized protein n=1 Tax=Hydrogenivirga caldilitoris TaxID=246264 RepID=A0A497XMN9_9AQUI|nr:hypothetical protein BCF55_0453 [Hydrogenivirga caldilitoris]
MKGVNFPSYIFASLVAGYVMLGVDLMLDGFLGLFGTYRGYIELIKIWGLFRGMEDWIMAAGHTINSVVLALVFVHPQVYRLVPPKNGLFKGLTFGAVWHLIVLFVLVITAYGGAKFMKEFLNIPLKDHISLFLLHLIWGGTLGLLYVPKASQ